MLSTIRLSLRHSSRAAGQLLNKSRARTYVNSGKPPMSQGGNNRNIIIGLLAVTFPVVYLMSSRDTRTQAQPSTDGASIPSSPPRSDPAERARAAKQQAEERGGQVKYEHPEQREPERFKPPFGQVHERKRVDGPPDGRNHQELNDRQKHI